jgi:PTH1 family peptidyl-tRNA hydrolase
MWVIAGLGNPGRKYSRTRHNIGFMVVEEVAQRYKIDLKEKKTYRVGRGSAGVCEVLLLEPLLYMNMSGAPIKKMMFKFSIRPENLIVIHDDLDMATGKLRIRKTGSSGGHKGIESVIQDIGTKDFIRVKIGIGREEGIPAEEYVLGKFKRHELGAIRDAISDAADAIDMIVSEGADRAMNRVNGNKIVSG